MAKQQAQARKNRSAKGADTSKGKVHFEGVRSKLNKTQRASLDAMEVLAKTLGVQMYVFESEVDENGNHVGANGWYDPSDGSIHIDLYAGADGKGTMLFTVAHELVHFIKQWSPSRFERLANFLTKQYTAKGQSISELVEDQQDKAARNGRELGYEEAYEEMVADSMETMLSDGSIIEMMAELRQQDQSLWQKICAWFKDLAGKLRAVVDAYKGVRPDSTEGRMVADMKDMIGTLQALYMDALVDASENFDAGVQKITTAESGGTVRYMARGETDTIKEQLLAVAEQLNKMEIVSSVQTNGYSGMRKDEIAKIIESEYAKFGKRVDRQNFGIILLEFNQINKALNYLNTDGEKAALLTVPRVLKRGIIAESHNKHKERQVDSITFAAPVEINGVRGNVAVVVQRVTGTNRFKTLRILLPNGKAFEFVKNDEADSTTGGSSKQLGLEGTPIESASKNSIRNPELEVKKKFSDRDSAGNQISAEQQEYFKDSKERDDQGQIRVMYRGDSTEVTVFDRKKSSYSNLYGRGFYFTNSASHAGQYGQATAYYLNITNPVSTTDCTITKEQMRKFLEAVAENEDDYSFENYGYGATIERVLEGLYTGKSDFAMLYDVSQTAIGDMVEAVELFNKINGTNFDGFILDTETVIFHSAQAKRADNRNPTANPDTRYSQRDVGRQEAVAQALEKENAKLREDVAELRELVKLQRKVTNGTKFTKTSVEAAARYLKQNAGAKGSTTELAKLLNGLYEYIASTRELTWEGVKEQAQAAVDWLWAHIDRRGKPTEYAQDILKQLHGSKVRLDESQMAEAVYRFGSYEAFRKGLMGRMYS